MQVHQYMTRHLVTVSMDDSLETVRETLFRYKIHHVIVLDDEHRVIGIISDRDFLRHVSPFAGTVAERSLDAASLRKRAHQIMTRPVLTVRPDTDVGDAALIILNHGVSCLPVIDADGTCLGVVTTRDMLRWAVETEGGKLCHVDFPKLGKSAA